MLTSFPHEQSRAICYRLLNGDRATMLHYFRNIMPEPGAVMVLNDRVNKPTYKCLVKLEDLFITAKLKWVRIRQKEHIV